jgi:hypothetical protein
MNFEELKVYRYTRAREESTDVLREEVRQLQISHEKKRQMETYLAIP